MQITMQGTHPAWHTRTKLRMILDCSRIAKEVAMKSGIFVEGRRPTLQVTRVRKIRKIFEATNRLLLKTRQSLATNLETQKQAKQIEIYQSQIRNHH